jgi:hypothetical protein
MNWLERARREITETALGPTAVTAESHPTAVLAVTLPRDWDKPDASNGSNGSTAHDGLLESEAMREEIEERAAILEFDGGMRRDEAERAARALVLKRYRLH